MLEFPEGHVEYADMVRMTISVDQFRRFLKGVRQLEAWVVNLESEHGWMEEEYSIKSDFSVSRLREKLKTAIEGLSDAGWRDGAYSALYYGLRLESVRSILKGLFGKNEELLSPRETLRKLYSH